MKFSIVSAKFSPQSFSSSQDSVSCQGGYILADSYLDSFFTNGLLKFVAELMSFNGGAQINNLAFVGHIFIFFHLVSVNPKGRNFLKPLFFPWEKCVTRPSPPKKKVLKMMYVSFACVFVADVFFRFFLGSFEKLHVEKG